MICGIGALAVLCIRMTFPMVWRHGCARIRDTVRSRAPPASRGRRIPVVCMPRSPLRDGSGRIVRWHNLLTDIDDRKQLYGSGLPRIVSNSAALRRILGMARLVAPTDATVLINGENAPRSCIEEHNVSWRSMEMHGVSAVSRNTPPNGVTTESPTIGTLRRVCDRPVNVPISTSIRGDSPFSVTSQMTEPAA